MPNQKFCSVSIDLEAMGTHIYSCAGLDELVGVPYAMDVVLGLC